MQFESSSLNHPFLFSGLKISFRPEKSSQPTFLEEVLLLKMLGREIVWLTFICFPFWVRLHNKMKCFGRYFYSFLQLNKLCWSFLFLLRLRNAHSLRKLIVKISVSFASVLLICSTKTYPLKKKSDAINIRQNIFD